MDHQKFATAMPEDQAAPGRPIRVVDEMLDANSDSPTTPAPSERPARNSSSLSGLRRVTRTVIFVPVVMTGGLDGTQAGTSSTGTGTYSVTVDRNTNLGGGTGAPIPAEQTIYHDPEHPSQLRFSVLDQEVHQ